MKHEERESRKEKKKPTEEILGEVLKTTWTKKA